MLNKTHPIRVFKALSSKTGEFEALVSVYGNVDLQGDRVMPGAFDNSLKAWQDSGDPIPVIWSHDWGNPNAHIGAVDPNQAKSTPEGLVVRGKLDVETNPFAAQVYKLMKERRVKEFSFAYDVLGEETAPDKANNLTELGIIEVGPTLKGANPATDLISVKTALETAAKAASDAHVYADAEPDGTKAGRVISAKNESKLRTAATAMSNAADAINEVLSSLDAGTPEPEKHDAPEAKSEEPAGAKDEEPEGDDLLLKVRTLLAGA